MPGSSGESSPAKAALVCAAGGVVVDLATGFVVLVHRPHYDDWSYPKGKLHRNEPPTLGALREVSEETGVSPKIVAALGAIRYPLEGGTTKVVWYYLMSARQDGAGADGWEVDQIEWLSLGEAPGRLTYAADAWLAKRIFQLMSR